MEEKTSLHVVSKVDGEQKQVEAYEGCPSNTDMQGKAQVCGGCSGQTMCSTLGAISMDSDDLDIRMRAIKHKILVVSGKGGQFFDD